MFSFNESFSTVNICILTLQMAICSAEKFEFVKYIFTITLQKNCCKIKEILQNLANIKNSVCIDLLEYGTVEFTIFMSGRCSHLAMVSSGAVKSTFPTWGRWIGQ